MHRFKATIALMSGLLAVTFSGCATMQGPKPSSRVTAVNGRSGDQALIEEFRGFLREQSDGWRVDNNRVTVALAEYVSIEDDQGNKFSLGYREWLAVCYSGETTYVKALTPSQLWTLRDLIRKGSQTNAVDTSVASVDDASQEERYQYLRSIWPSDSILTPTSTGFSRLGFVYTGIVDEATVREAKEKYRKKFGEELLLESFGG